MIGGKGGRKEGRGEYSRGGERERGGRRDVEGEGGDRRGAEIDKAPARISLCGREG